MSRTCVSRLSRVVLLLLLTRRCSIGS